jgi:hypothetical protein
VRAVPAELPHAAGGFIGRRWELDRLDALMGGAVESGQSPAIVVLEGMGGIGKPNPEN